MISDQIGDVRSMFRLRGSEAVLTKRRVSVSTINEKNHVVVLALPSWWIDMQSNWHKAGCGDMGNEGWIYSPLNNKRFMRPGWMRGWYHDKKNLPALDTIRCPGNLRTESALPLPKAPTDVYSQKVMVEAIIPYPEIFRISTPLNVVRFEELLRGFPNSAHSDSWICALRQGLWPWSGNFGQDSAQGVLIPNPTSMNQHRAFINSIRQKEVGMGHWRQLSVVPKYFRNSPLSVVPKPEGGNRLIQNLSFPEGNSVNDQIPVKEGRVTYDDIGALAMVMVVLHSMGVKNWVPWKLDVSRAFRNIPLHPLYALRNGVIVNSRKGSPIYFVDSQACFGGRAFPRAYCSAADLVGWIATEKNGVSILLRFVDDHFGISASTVTGDEPDDMRLLRQTFEQLNIPTNDKHGFGNGLVIIGKEIDYEQATIQLTKEKLIKYLTMFVYFLKRTNITIGEIDHIGGVMNYCLDISPIGKPFNRVFDIIKAKYHGRNQSYRIQMSSAMEETLHWWAYNLASRPIRYLLNEYWWSSEEADEIIFTDASTSFGLGVFWVTKKTAYYHLYNQALESIKILQGPRKDALVHINTMELLAVISAVQIVGKSIQSPQAARKIRLIVMCDNAAVCEILWKMSSSDILIVQLLKDMVMELTNIDLRVCHISTQYNPADYLTKGSEKLHQFQQMFAVDGLYCFIPSCIEDYLKRAQLTML